MKGTVAGELTNSKKSSQNIYYKQNGLRALREVCVFL